jgi:RNA polymerase sigma-70 factor (ECF subfamily)
MDRLSDEQIIGRVLRGDTNAFKEIVVRYQQHIFGIGMRFLKNENDVYDLVQEVFIKAYSNLSSYLGNTPFRFWLVKIAYNHAINTAHARQTRESYVRQAPHSDIYQDQCSVSAEPSPEKTAIKIEAREVLLAAISRLPEQYQMCLDFHFFLGLSYEEISSITGIPINTIKSNVSRAKMALRDTLRGTVAEDYHEM